MLNRDVNITDIEYFFVIILWFVLLLFFLDIFVLSNIINHLSWITITNYKYKTFPPLYEY